MTNPASSSATLNAMLQDAMFDMCRLKPEEQQERVVEAVNEICAFHRNAVHEAFLRGVRSAT